MRVVTRLAGALARHTGQEEEEVKRHQFSKLGTCLQRGNSVILADSCNPRNISCASFNHTTRSFANIYSLSLSVDLFFGFWWDREWVFETQVFIW